MSLSFSGNQFLNNGSLFQPLGPNVAGFTNYPMYEYTPQDPQGGLAANPLAVLSWNANSVRIGVNEAVIMGGDVLGWGLPNRVTFDPSNIMRIGDPGNNVISIMQAYIQSFIAIGMHVLLELHWSSPSSLAPLNQDTMANWQNSLPFWAYFVKIPIGAYTIGTHPAITLEGYNEPALDWQYGDTGSQFSAGSAWATMMGGGVVQNGQHAGLNIFTQILRISQPQQNFWPGDIITQGAVSATVQSYDPGITMFTASSGSSNTEVVSLNQIWITNQFSSVLPAYFIDITTGATGLISQNGLNVAYFQSTLSTPVATGDLCAIVMPQIYYNNLSGGTFTNGTVTATTRCTMQPLSRNVVNFFATSTGTGTSVSYVTQVAVSTTSQYAGKTFTDYYTNTSATVSSNTTGAIGSTITLTLGSSLTVTANDSCGILLSTINCQASSAQQALLNGINGNFNGSYRSVGVVAGGQWQAFDISSFNPGQGGTLKSVLFQYLNQTYEYSPAIDGGYEPYFAVPPGTSLPVALTLATGPSTGAISATLASPWPYNTCFANVTFSNAQQVVCGFVSGQSAVTLKTALSSNCTTAISITIWGNGYYSAAASFTLRTNTGAGGGSAPAVASDEIIYSQTGLQYTNYQTMISTAGSNPQHWIRMLETAANGSVSNTDIQGNFNLWDCTYGMCDGWFFLGDSITANWGSSIGPRVTAYASADAFENMCAANGGRYAGGYFPPYVCGGQPIWTLSNYLQILPQTMQRYPGRYVYIALGTNDAAAYPGLTVAGFKALYTQFVYTVLAAGKIPVVPTIPFTGNAQYTAGIAAFNPVITGTIWNIPGVIAGPDMYTLLSNHQAASASPWFTNAGDLHPNGSGQAGMIAAIASFASSLTTTVSATVVANGGWVAAGQTQIKDAIRAQGATRPLWMQGLSFGTRFDQMLANWPNDNVAPAGYVGTWNPQLGASAHFYQPEQGLSTFTISNGGSGWTTTDQGKTITFEVTGAGGQYNPPNTVFTPVTLVIQTVNGGGAITALTLTGGNNGDYLQETYSGSVLPASLTQFSTTGAGSGVVIIPTAWYNQANQNSVTNFGYFTTISQTYPVTVTEYGCASLAGWNATDPWDTSLFAKLDALSPPVGRFVWVWPYNNPMGSSPTKWAVTLNGSTASTTATPAPGMGQATYNDWISK
jgi:hypothetical protein